MKTQVLITIDNKYAPELLGFLDILMSGKGPNAVDVQVFSKEQMIGHVAGLVNTKHIEDSLKAFNTTTLSNIVGVPKDDSFKNQIWGFTKKEWDEPCHAAEFPRLLAQEQFGTTDFDQVLQQLIKRFSNRENVYKVEQ